MLARLLQYLSESRERARQGHLPLYQQLVEMLVLNMCYGLGPGFYHKGQFWRRDIPWQSKTRYRIGTRYRRLVDQVNDRQYYKVSQNKVSEKAMLSLFQLPIAEFYGHLHPVDGRTVDANPLRSAGDFMAFCGRCGVQVCAVKMPEGLEGRGFDIIEINTHEPMPLYSRALEKRFTAEAYVALKLEEFEGQGILFEAALEQHPVLAALNPSSVNCLRLWVRQWSDGVSVRSALLKIGYPGGLTDYSKSGGFSVAIDVHTGKLGQPHWRVARNSSVDRDQIEGVVCGISGLPFLKEAFTLAERCIAAFPGVGFAGLDIAITPQGPVIVELNVEPDSGHAASVGIPTLDLLSPLPGQPLTEVAI